MGLSALATAVDAFDPGSGQELPVATRALAEALGNAFMPRCAALGAALPHDRLALVRVAGASQLSRARSLRSSACPLSWICPENTWGREGMS
jgi:hypothetical protein